jgi:hypothetical protein
MKRARGSNVQWTSTPLAILDTWCSEVWLILDLLALLTPLTLQGGHGDQVSMGVEADILAQGPPGLRDEVLSWRQLKTRSLFIVQQTVGEKSAVLGEGESVGRKASSACQRSNRSENG